jgi:hypothetical protein
MIFADRILALIPNTAVSPGGGTILKTGKTTVFDKPGTILNTISNVPICESTGHPPFCNCTGVQVLTAGG